MTTPTRRDILKAGATLAVAPVAMMVERVSAGPDFKLLDLSAYLVGDRCEIEIAAPPPEIPPNFRFVVKPATHALVHPRLAEEWGVPTVIKFDERES